MAKNPYLVRTGHPEDCVDVHRGGSSPLEVRDFFLPVEPIQKDEITCMMFHKRSEEKPYIDYHQHTSGSETFIPISGKIEIIAQGVKTYMVPGDIFHIQPFMSHSFQAVEDESYMMCLFQGFDMINTVNLHGSDPYTIEDEKHRALYNERCHKMDRLVPDPIDRAREDVFCLRRQGIGLFSYSYPGIDLHLKVGRWETHGQREMWEANMKKGVKIAWDLQTEYRLFFINKGNVEFTINGKAFTVDEEALVRIPPFNKFSIECKEDSRVYDLDCPDMLHSMLEELGDPAKDRAPKDPDELRALKEKFGCTVVSCEYKPG